MYNFPHARPIYGKRVENKQVSKIGPTGFVLLGLPYWGFPSMKLLKVLYMYMH